MIKFLSDLFGGKNAIRTESFDSWQKKMTKWRTDSVYPALYDLPDAFSFPDYFWKRVINLYKSTKSDGHERAISVFWVDGELVLTEVIRGSTSSVQSKNEIAVTYDPILKSGKYDYFRRKITIDGKKYSEKEVYHKKVPKKLESPIYLFNMHTHPPHGLDGGFAPTQFEISNKLAGDYVGNSGYGYWSAQDIKSLLTSGAIITGLVTDVFYLLVRSNQTPTSSEDLIDSIISDSYLKEQLKLGVYAGRFGEKVFCSK